MKKEEQHSKFIATHPLHEGGTLGSKGFVENKNLAGSFRASNSGCCQCNWWMAKASGLLVSGG